MVSQPNDDTRDRILNEAEALFAERGYEAVSVREITQKAGCNLAAVNYHFGNKKNLYLEVFRLRVVPRSHRLQEVFWAKLKESRDPDLETVIRALATAFLKGPLTEKERRAHQQLLAREIANPSDAFGIMAEEAMRPFFKEFGSRLRPLLRADLEDEALFLHIMSMFSQVLFFHFSRTAVTMITGKAYDEDFISTLIDHITNFALHGYGRVARKETPRAPE